MRLFAALSAAVLAAGLLGVLGWGLARAQTQGVRVGSPAPDLTVALLDGSPLSLSAYRGHPAVVNFWATWCADCTKEAPALSAAAKAHAGVRFLGVLYKDNPEAARAYQASSLGYPYAVGYAPAGSDRFGVSGNIVNLGQFAIGALPETVFLDARGIVRVIEIGPLTRAQLNADLAKVGA